ncbi:MAG: PKD domain-containing protein [Candidatus Hydrogenedens sp.]|nr:PKD domain-containing protein [Candidatus Hydrogenedens sp.]
MKSTHTAAGLIAGLILMALILPGCPPQLGVELVVSQDTLDFGYDRSEEVVKVHVNQTGTRTEPLQVTADQAWILPQNCLDFKDGCISAGPYHDLILRIRIDRNKLAMGLNTGAIRLRANPASVKTIQIVAQEIAQADFYVRQSSVALGKAVEFVDLSQVAEEAGNLVAWKWEFGDGNESTAINPTHVYAQPGIYDVRLTIQTSKGLVRTVEQKALVQVESPSADVDFSASTTKPEVGEAVIFTDHSTVKNVTVTGRKWIFGDGTETSFNNDKSVTHRFSRTGVFTVALQLKTSHGILESVKENYIIVRSGTAPVADFGFESDAGLLYVNEEIRFYDRSHPGTGTITDRSWNFGDGTISNAAAPVHRYNGQGNFTVTLSVQTEKGFSTKEKVLTLNYRVPKANFTAKPTRQKVDQPVAFKDTSSPGHGGNVAWAWDFGDGNTSAKQHPTHVYTERGTYTVTLTVTGGDPTGLSDTITRENFILITDFIDDDDDDDDGDETNGLTDLQDFIEHNDGAYSYSPVRTEPLLMDDIESGTIYIIDRMTSQRWNPDNSVHPDYVEWFHPMTIFEPNIKKTDTAMLFIDGGSRTSPPKLEPAFGQMAVLSGTTIVHIRNIPCQPIVFLEDVIPAGRQDNYSDAEIILRRRTEDDIFAFSYDEYMKSWRENDGKANFHWPTIFPMAKAAVKGMDTAEAVLRSRAGITLDGFIIAGASKRGWTTWLAGAGDDRVKAIAPIVINVLNMPDHLAHHRASYGYWSPAIYPYAQEAVFDHLLPDPHDGSIVPEALALLDRVDPYAFALKGCYPMPKFMINGTGDQFFVPDTTQFYFDDLENEKHLCYIPNAGHDLGGIENADVADPANPLGKFFAWYLTVSQEKELPQFTHSFERDGSILVQVDPENRPLRVRLCQATSSSRDFRNEVMKAQGVEWTYRDLSPTGGLTTYRGTVSQPAPGKYTAFFVELEYANPSSLTLPIFDPPSLVFTTGVKTLPVANGEPVYPEFTGYLANRERPDAVPFSEQKLPVAVVYGTPREMGKYYGEVLGDQINDTIPEIIAASELPEESLREIWDDLEENFLDERMLEEINGLALASKVTVTRDMLNMAHAAMVHAAGSAAIYSTAAYGNIILDTAPRIKSMHSATVNDSFGLKLAPYQCAVVYIPDEGVPHTVFTYAGLTFGHTGVNLGGISGADIPNMTPDADLSTGMPLLREVLYDSLNLRQAVSAAQQGLTRGTGTVFADGRNEVRTAYVSTFPQVERFDMTQDQLAYSVPGMIFGSSQDSVGTLKFLLESNVSKFTSDTLFDITTSNSLALPKNNVLNVIYEGEPLTIIVQTSTGLASAKWDEPEYFNMQLLFP